jgi:hypothetical protein
MAVVRVPGNEHRGKIKNLDAKILKETEGLTTKTRRHQENPKLFLLAFLGVLVPWW